MASIEMPKLKYREQDSYAFAHQIDWVCVQAGACFYFNFTYVFFLLNFRYCCDCRREDNLDRRGKGKIVVWKKSKSEVEERRETEKKTHTERNRQVVCTGQTETTRIVVVAGEQSVCLCVCARLIDGTERRRPKMCVYISECCECKIGGVANSVAHSIEFS